jgi:hypothetical protein
MAFHPPIFPYIATRIVPSMYHIIPLPKLEMADLLKITYFQQSKNDLQTCLVAGAGHALYVNRPGEAEFSDFIPMGGVIVAERLHLGVYFNLGQQMEEEYRLRQKMLSDAIVSQAATGYMRGDPTHGGRKATSEELENLSGPNPHFKGVPNGLIFCSNCHMFRGACLDPSIHFIGQIMTVNCKCENENYCARCFERLDGFKLNANSYEQNAILHNPGFVGLSHKCPDVRSQLDPSLEYGEDIAKVISDSVAKRAREMGIENEDA